MCFSEFILTPGLDFIIFGRIRTGFVVPTRQVEQGDVGGIETVLRTLVSAFLVIRLECRKLPLTWEDVLVAWFHRPTIEIVLRERCHRERLIERIDAVYPF